MSIDPADESLDPRIGRYLSRRKKDGLRVRSVTALAGDASMRSYFRVNLSGDPERQTMVLALQPEPFDPEREPFLNVARLFQKMPVRVPKIHDVSGPEGILLLEDCGDELLQTLIANADGKATRALYEQSIAILARIQKRGADLESAEYLPYGIAFDQEKLHWELSFFRQHFLEGLRKASLDATELEMLDSAFSSIATELAARPRVLCHRDYHSRNLLLVGNELVVLDFQDARMGPVSYDLVSLLRDSYVELGEELVEEMREQFLSATSTDRRSFEEEFDLMALQRNLKALGTFGNQIAVRGKVFYERYVPHTLRMVKANLAQHSERVEWDGLRRVLAAHLPEMT